jgi:5-methyltetrahydrofolate--homocysteine methyltransferase
MTDLLSRLLAERAWLLADGATGTNLFALGLGHGDSPELWNADHPDRVRTHYRSFLEAGSDIILTNTFGGNRERLKLHGGQDRVYELNKAAAELARAEVDRLDRPAVVAGSSGVAGAVAVSVLLLGGGGTLHAVAVLPGGPFAVLSLVALAGLTLTFRRHEGGHTSPVRRLLGRLPVVEIHHDVEPPKDD